MLHPHYLVEAHSYSGMSVANGNDAQRAFEELNALDISIERKDHLRNAML